MIAIADYGAGNLFSLQSSLAHIGAQACVTADPTVLDSADHIIVPGVGAFGDAICSLHQSGLAEVVRRQAHAGKPTLGICLGMQLFFEQSCEFGRHDGLSLLPGRVIDLQDTPDMDGLKIPHMGWNSLDIVQPHPIFKYFTTGSHVYYVHSFFVPQSDVAVGVTEYGGARITGVAASKNVCGCQFHPEKSGAIGLSLLRAFCEMR